MSLSAPSRRITGRCLFCQPLAIRPRIQQQQQRTAWFGRGSGNDNSSTEPKSNPVLEEWRRRHGDRPTPQQQQQQQMADQRPGDLSSSSIFEDDRRAQQQVEQHAADREPVVEGKTMIGGKERDLANTLRVLDPDPNARERWERKKVIQMIRKGGRLTKPQLIKRTEREHLLRSHNMKTSIKKLGMLARQIAGKTIDDAITQMRFSKKKVAQEVLTQLEYARDEAVVMRGMGLGGVEAQEDAGNLNDTSPSVSGVAPVEGGASISDVTGRPTQIQLKDGKRHTVTNPSTIYIDQAWVGRGPFGQLPDYRARGRVFIMRTPWTSISILLKEEATRVRQHAEREEKRKSEILGKNLWTHLPDRPVQWQRQWYTF